MTDEAGLSGGQHVVDGLGGLKLVPILGFLATDAVAGPRHGVEALRFDVFLAVEAYTIAAASLMR